MKILWLRLGDNADYESYDLDISAVSEAIAETIRLYDMSIEKITWNSNGGLMIYPFYEGYNYISLYWGDKDANLISDLTPNEQSEVENYIREFLK